MQQRTQQVAAMTTFHENARGYVISSWIMLNLGLIILQVNVRGLTASQFLI